MEEILEIKATLANAQSIYKGTSSVVLNLQAKLDQLEPILLKNQMSAVEAAIIINNAEIESEKNALKELESDYKVFPNLINEFSKIISEQKLIQQNLIGLLSAKEKLELELSQGTNPWRLISKPYVNPSPFKPEVRKELIYGLLVSLFSGLSITYLFDKLDNVFHSLEDIEFEKSLPSILGLIPFFKISREIEDDSNSKETNLNINDFILKENEKYKIKFYF